MDKAADIAARAQRFNEAAPTLTLPSPTRHAKLAPFKDGIMELRSKGTSLRLIRELLAPVHVAVETDTIAPFPAELRPIRCRSVRENEPVVSGAVAPRPIRTSIPSVTSVPISVAARIRRSSGALHASAASDCAIASDYEKRDVQALPPEFGFRPKPNPSLRARSCSRGRATLMRRGGTFCLSNCL